MPRQRPNEVYLHALADISHPSGEADSRTGIFGLLRDCLRGDGRRIEFDDIARIRDRGTPGDELTQGRLIGGTPGAAGQYPS